MKSRTSDPLIFLSSVVQNSNAFESNIPSDWFNLGEKDKESC